MGPGGIVGWGPVRICCIVTNASGSLMASILAGADGGQIATPLDPPEPLAEGAGVDHEEHVAEFPGPVGGRGIHGHGSVLYEYRGSKKVSPEGAMNFPPEPGMNPSGRAWPW